MFVNRKTAAALFASVLLTAGAVGTAQAASTGGAAGASAPSACRPANHRATIVQDQSSAGHIHFRVTLTAPAGYAPCTLAGSPTDARFAYRGKAVGTAAGSYGDQGQAVTFGPGRPVHFDIQVPNLGTTRAADTAEFTLTTPGGGTIPGASGVTGTFRVADGTRIGPVQPGA
ncbi:DUF4232 domain-containing protein (plasmid) [Streptomyces sp. BI20]|uniref:DUF4232 domain-containing protein n=1 Tax=Streptomyces sp. BI20 TaxID=3403460 RepID=UPI003C7621B2